MFRRVACSLIVPFVLATTAAAIEDTQLRKAVEVLLDNLDTDPRTEAW